MKKLISLLLGVCIIATLLPIMPIVSATTSGATLIFDMNLDGVSADGETGFVTSGVTNSVTGTTTAIAGKSRLASGDGSEHRPILGVDEKADFKFLRFSYPIADSGRENKQAGLEVTFNDESYFNNNEFTFETWARGTNLNPNDGDFKGNYYAYLGLFTLGTKPSNDETAFSTSAAYIGTFFGTGSAHNIYNLNLNNVNVESCLKNGTIGTTEPTTQHTFGGAANILSAYEDELVHYAITMKWEPDTTTTDSETDGTWTSDLYVNGTKKCTLTKDEASRPTFSEGDITTLLIGATPHTQGSPTFCGEIADFKMYTGVRTEAEIKATYQEEIGAYQPFDLTNGAELTEAADATATTPLNVNGGEIVLEFSHPVDKDSLNNITFTDGTHYPAAVVKTTTGATVKFGHLKENANYTLTIPQDLKSANNKTLGQGYSYTFKSGTKQYVVNENFNNYSAGDTLEETIVDGRPIFYVSTSPTSTNNDTSDGNATVGVDTESGDKYLHITAPSTGTAVNTYLLVSVPVNYNKMTALALSGGDNDINVFDIDVRGTQAVNDSTSAVTVLGNKAPDTGTVKTPIAFTSMGQMYSPKGNTILGNEKEQKDFSKAEDGFYKARMVTRLTGNKGGTDLDGQEQLMAFDLYDMNARSLLGTIADGNDIYEADSMRYYIAGYVYSKDAKNDGNYIDVTSVKMYEEKYLEVLDISDFDASTQTISLKMSDDVDEDSLSTITAVKTTAPAGDPVSPIDAAYDPSTRTLTITFEEDTLEYEAEYKLDISKVVTPNLIPFEVFEEQMGPRTFTAKESTNRKLDVVLKDGNGDIIVDSEDLDAATTVTAHLTVKRYDGFGELSPVSILVLYKGDALVKIKASTSSDVWVKDEATGYYSQTLTIDGLDDVSVDKARVYMWDEFTSLRPLFVADDCL